MREFVLVELGKDTNSPPQSNDTAEKFVSSVKRLNIIELYDKIRENKKVDSQLESQ